MPNMIEIQLRTTFADGQECVNRTPPVINKHKRDVDVVRITNKNPPGSGSSITVTMDPDTLGDVFQNPPADPQVLAPGQSFDLTVKGNLTGIQSEGFSTDPDSCQEHDAGDIVIEQ